MSILNSCLCAMSFWHVWVWTVQTTGVAEDSQNYRILYPSFEICLCLDGQPVLPSPYCVNPYVKPNKFLLFNEIVYLIWFLALSLS